MVLGNLNPDPRSHSKLYARWFSPAPLGGRKGRFLPFSDPVARHLYNRRPVNVSLVELICSRLAPSHHTGAVVMLSCLSSTGWSGENQHGEADLLCPLSSREAGSHRCLPLREAHPRCGAPSLWVRHVVRGNKMDFQKLHYIFRVR